MEYLYYLAASLTVALLVRSKLKRNEAYASGPVPWPLVGNIWTLFRLHTDTERVLARLGREYGDLTMLWIGNWPAMVINSCETAHDILHKDGAKTASRPTHNDLRIRAGRGRLVLTPAGPDFVKLRKVYHALLNSGDQKKSISVVEAESILFLSELLNAPHTFYESCERYVLSIIFTSVYGTRLKTVHNEVVAGLFRVWDVMLKYFQPGTVLPDFLPSLFRLPYWAQPWKVLSDRLIGSELAIHDTFISRIRELSDQGIAPECYCRTLLEQKENYKIDDEQLRGVLAMIIGAGSDTTGSVIQSFFKVMALYPEVVAQAQQELDEVVGRSRLPSLEDQPNLPYIRAVIKEVRRWAPIGCIGIPHAATESFSHNGRLIPKGTIIFPNLVTLNRDPSRYVDPDKFDPSRFFDDPNNASACAVHADWKQRDHFHYGFGRRLCPGVDMGELSLFIAVSRILWAFDIRKNANCKLDMFEKICKFLRVAHLYCSLL
ncbi:cytochrome P450 [Aaosphaeria arxii CBS 175.79]|uniref:Cytochrome P450 n=1 Tax=Aaosphaeria arxii CBS 175.79 TaxID=1450172 RepID=A0A6A5XIR8_9PLEO|nr:cytochrome P450 [Aaosphaeria arxii CBS 175.79]KAF2012756.1 cytochrome P450 [Aaosphaeria arxii CBS 175.79]